MSNVVTIPETTIVGHAEDIPLFGRACEVTVGLAPKSRSVGDDGVVTLEEVTVVGGQTAGSSKPGIKLTNFDVSFRIEKTLAHHPNTCLLQIYNLNEEHRAALEQLAPKGKKGDKKALSKGVRLKGGIPVRIDAGYGMKLSTLWFGNLRTCNSIRQGADWITRLEAGDGEKAIQNARINASVGPSTSSDQVLRQIARALGVGEGNIGQVASDLQTKVFPVGTVMSGSAANELTGFCKSHDFEWSIQDETLQVLPRGKALATSAIKVSENTGMIDSPTVDTDGLLTVSMLMVPGVQCGGLLVVDAARVKGNYRILKAQWTGETFGNDWKVVCHCERY